MCFPSRCPDRIRIRPVNLETTETTFPTEKVIRCSRTDPMLGAWGSFGRGFFRSTAAATAVEKSDGRMRMKSSGSPACETRIESSAIRCCQRSLRREGCRPQTERKPIRPSVREIAKQESLAENVP